MSKPEEQIDIHLKEFLDKAPPPAILQKAFRIANREDSKAKQYREQLKRLSNKGWILQK